MFRIHKKELLELDQAEMHKRLYFFSVMLWGLSIVKHSHLGHPVSPPFFSKQFGNNQDSHSVIEADKQALRDIFHVTMYVENMFHWKSEK